MNEEDIINEYAYDLDRYNTYEELVSALRYDERIEYEKDDAYYLDLATQVISKADCIVCDRCSSIVYCDDAFGIDYDYKNVARKKKPVAKTAPKDTEPAKNLPVQVMLEPQTIINIKKGDITVSITGISLDSAIEKLLK